MVIRIFSLLILFSPALVGCTGNRKEQKNGNTLISKTEDRSALFDGKTLGSWEITIFGPQGPVYISGDQIILGMGDGCTGITWKKDLPVSNYEITLEARRMEGNDFFCGMTFPVGKDPCTLIIGGWGGSVVGLSSINGMDASENETMILKQFEKERWYKIRLRVAADSIKSWIDDTLVVDFAIRQNILSIRPEVELSKPFGIASWRTTAAIRNIRLRSIKVKSTN